MMRFNNDYNRSAHPLILQTLLENQGESFGGYGKDDWCKKAEEAIKKHLCSPSSQVHFLVGGTQANFTLIAAGLKPWQSVLAADTGHIAVHETGAVEHTGHKVETLPHQDGKLTAEGIEAVARAYRQSPIPEHITCPKMVYLSHPTELGTLYSKEELEKISAVCKEFGLYLFLDGARLGYGLAAEPSLTLADLARLTDAFYIGGTKCGALFGEAMVIQNPALQEDFRHAIKQNGGLLAKGWLLGLQFYTLFEKDLYFSITARAIKQAKRIKEAFLKKGVPLYIDSPSNQQFVVLTSAQKEFLAKDFTFEPQETLPDGREAVRFCTAWSTEDAEVDALLAAIERMD